MAGTVMMMMPMQRVEQLRQMLIDQGNEQSAQVIDLVKDHIMAMESQHRMLYQELQGVKEQLATVQESMSLLHRPEPREPLAERYVAAIEKQISGIGDQISSMKTKLGERAARLIVDLRAHGIIAQDKIVEGLGLKELFRAVGDHFARRAVRAQQTLDKLDAMNKEVNAVKTHAGNIGRAAIGKELKEVPEKRGILFKMLTALNTRLLRACQENSARAYDMVARIEGLGARAIAAQIHLEDKSVVKKLEQFRSDVQGQQGQEDRGLAENEMPQAAGGSGPKKEDGGQIKHGDRAEQR